MDEEERYGVASASGDASSLHLWLRRDGGSRATQNGCRPRNVACMSSVPHRGHLFSASLNPSGSATLLCAHALWRAVGGPIARCSAPEPIISSVAVSPDGTFLVAGGESGRCYIWSLAAGVLLATWDAHFRAVTRLAFTDDSETILTGGADAAVFAYDVAQLVSVERARGSGVAPVATLQGHSLPIAALSVGFGGSSARVVTASADRTAHLWHLSSARDIGSVLLSAPVVDAAFAPDESACFLGLASGAVVIVQPSQLSGAATVSDRSLPKVAPPVMQGKSSPAVTAMATSPLGSELIVGYADGQIRVYDVATCVLLMTYSKHGDVAVTWLGVVRNMSDYVGQESGGGLGRAQGLLFEGGLGRVVDTDLKENFCPKVMLVGESSRSGAWEAIDSALESAATGRAHTVQATDDMGMDTAS
jgi:WD40 repeat protein